MKKLALAFALVFVCIGTKAQGLKGTWFAGGNLSYTKTEFSTKASDDLNAKAFTIMPLAGKFIAPTVAVGGALGYTHSDTDGLKNNTFTVMPLARKYWNISGNLYVFGQMALPLAFGKIKNDMPDIDTFGMHLEVSPGFDLIVNDWMTIEAYFTLFSTGFSRVKQDGTSATNWTFKGETINGRSFGDMTVGVKFLF